MSLTRLDCHFYRGDAAINDTSSFVAINPSKSPGSLVIAASAAARESIGSQVACKLGLEHFINGVLDFYDGVLPDGSAQNQGAIKTPQKREREISLDVLEAAFKNANSSVYSFGHKLAAGGRMAASLIGLVLEDNTLAAGKVGTGSIYLYRKGELFPFFINEPLPEHAVNNSFIGSNSMVAVELASVPVEESDSLVVFPFALSQEKELILRELMGKVLRSKGNPCETLCRQLFDDVVRIPFAILSCIGPDSIYLREAV